MASKNTPITGTFANRYRIVRCLGQGGMGSVYLVKDKLLKGDQFALKILHREFSKSQSYRRRFLQEIQLSRRVTHRNVVRTFEVDEEKGGLYFSMEYLEGEPLDSLLGRRGVRIDHAIYLINEIAAGLAAIHDAGILHRDLTAGNIMVSRRKNIKITDFGIATVSNGKRNRKGGVLGTGAYTAPEAWNGQAVTASDIYSLGVVAYQIITGMLPFEGEHQAEMRRLHEEVMPKPPRSVRENVPSWLDSLTMSMLNKTAAARPSSAYAICETIRANCAGESIDYVRALQIALEVSDLADGNSNLADEDIASFHCPLEENALALVKEPKLPCARKSKRESGKKPKRK